MTKALRDWAESRGYHVAWAPTSVLEKVREDLQRRERQGEIDPAFARKHLPFDFDRYKAAGNDWRVVVVVMPRAAHLVGFTVDGTRIDVLLPPTYQRYVPTLEDVRRELAEQVLPGCRVETLNVSLKPLAARMGLVRYGRNNVTYASAIGSYLQLLGYLTDASLAIEPGWTSQEPALLDECEHCNLCEAVCPTAAIGLNRVLLRAERCLTLATETPGPWPPHISPSAHHCLIGCLRCQQVCPVNPELPVVDTGVVFGEHETGALLDEGGAHTGPTWERIRARLEQLGQPYMEEILGRNLRALLAAPRPMISQTKNAIQRADD